MNAVAEETPDTWLEELGHCILLFVLSMAGYAGVLILSVILAAVYTMATRNGSVMERTYWISVAIAAIVIAWLFCTALEKPRIRYFARTGAISAGLALPAWLLWLLF